MKTHKCPIVFSEKDCEPPMDVLQGADLFRYISLDDANRLAAAQWQAYVDGLQEVVSSQNEKGTRIWWAKDLWQKIYRKPHTHVTRILPPEKL